MKLIFFGSGAFGLPTLTRLAETHELLAVVTQPDRPAGRRRQPTATPVGEWSAAQRPDLPLLKPEDVNDAEPLTQLRAMDAAAWVNGARPDGESFGADPSGSDPSGQR